MDILIFLGIFLLLALVIAFLSAPLRAVRRSGGSADAHPNPSRSSISHPVSIAEREELEAAREAKYREIRDAELDYRTGKLSADDYAAIDGDLRAEALAILNSLEQLDAEVPSSPAESQPEEPSSTSTA